MRGSGRGRFGRVEGEEFRAELGEVDFLCVGCFGGVFAEDHGAG